MRPHQNHWVRFCRVSPKDRGRGQWLSTSPPPPHLCWTRSHHSHDHGGENNVTASVIFVIAVIVLCFVLTKLNALMKHAAFLIPPATWTWFPCLYTSPKTMYWSSSQKYIKWNNIIVSNLKGQGKESSGKSDKVSWSWGVKHTKASHKLQYANSSGAPIPQSLLAVIAKRDTFFISWPVFLCGEIIFTSK